MVEVVTVVFAGAVLLVAAGLGTLVLTYVLYAAGQVFSNAAELFSSYVVGAFEGLAQAADDRVRYRNIQADILSNVRPLSRSARVNRQFVQAAEATKCISAALKVTKTAMDTCCEVQKFTAQAQGATDMSEVEWEPLCVSLRQRVLDSIDVTLSSLVDCPNAVKERRILKQTVALHSLRQVCETCELMRYTVAKAPPLCSPAASL